VLPILESLIPSYAAAMLEALEAGDLDDLARMLDLLAALGGATTTISIGTGGVQKREPRHVSFDIQCDNEKQKCDDDADTNCGVAKGHESDWGCQT